MSRLLAHGCWSRYFGARCCPYLHRWDSSLVNPSLRFRLFLAAGPFPTLDQGSLVHCSPETIQQPLPKACTHHDQVFFSSLFNSYRFLLSNFQFLFPPNCKYSYCPHQHFGCRLNARPCCLLTKHRTQLPPLTTNNQLAHILLRAGTVSLVPDRSNGLQINGVIAGQGSRP